MSEDYTDDLFLFPLETAHSIGMAIAKPILDSDCRVGVKMVLMCGVWFPCVVGLWLLAGVLMVPLALVIPVIWLWEWVQSSSKGERRR